MLQMLLGGGKKMAMTDAAASRLDLLDRATRYATDDYDQGNAAFAALDSKAQSTFGISGVFVAGTIALINNLKDQGDGVSWVVAALLATYVVLIGAVVTSIKALRVRDVATPISSDSMTQMTLDMVALPDQELTSDMRAGWYLERLRVWGDVIGQLEKTNSEKALLVRRSQRLLVGALVLAGIAATLAVAIS
jgi:hypothetical protein